tara:strand:- start:92 stop:409 length:318 start_codon:yes stop_codon:yes gene_type:complete
MADVKLYRLTTGEDVIGKTKEEIFDESGNSTHVIIEKPYVIIPQQEAPGKPVTLGFHQYIPYGKCDEVTFKQDNIVTSVEPNDELRKTYQANTGGIVEVEKQLIT